MSSNNLPYYAVRKGRRIGIFRTWEETKKYVTGYNGAQYKKFTTLDEAKEFMKGNNVTNKKITKNKISAIVEEEDKYLIAFTDGSSLGNNRQSDKCTAFYAVVWPYHEDWNVVYKVDACQAQTNNRAELYAIITAFEIAEEQDRIYERTLIIYTDSMYCLNIVTEWMNKWKANNWKKSTGLEIENKDLVMQLDELIDKRKIIMCHIRAHQKEVNWFTYYNNKVDRLTRSIYE